jgi:type I restriction enzyme S subunit
MKLTKYKLGDVATFDISNVDKKFHEGEREVRLCNFTDVYYNWAVTSDMQSTFMQATASTAQIEKFTIQRGQVAITKDSETRHDIGIPCYIADDFENVVLGYHCALITPDPEKLDGRYLNAYLNSKVAKEYFANNASGSGQRYALGIDAIKGITLFLPSIQEQRLIGKLFSDIDRKIAENRAINRNLEAIAKQLYDYWFVQFDFPDENGKPYKSSGGKMVWNDQLKREIPEGWNTCKLGDLIDFRRGISYSTKTITGNGIPMINLATFSVNGSFKYDGLKTYSGEYNYSKVLKAYDLVMCNTQQTAIDFTKDIIGKAMLVPPFYNGDVVSSHHVTTLVPKSINSIKFYLAYLTNTGFFHRYAAGCCTGTNITGLNIDGLKQYKMEVPTDCILNKFSNITKDIIDKCCINSKVNSQLIKLRDELLPLLMNGQVTVTPPAVNCDL